MVSGTLLLGFILPLPFLRPGAPRTDPQAWQELRLAFEARGVVIRSDHPRCQEPNLDGLYVRGQRTVVVCNRGDRSHTLRHEGWHLAQSLCLLDGPWLSNSAITQALTRQDRLELQALVQPERWRREAPGPGAGLPDPFTPSRGLTRLGNPPTNAYLGSTRSSAALSNPLGRRANGQNHTTKVKNSGR